jgi:hypothetical protein
VATYGFGPVQARMMTKQDLADLRRWHRNAVLRAMRAGYDLLYVYAGHSFGGIEHFLSPRYNQRTDEYGGSARNRMRLLREILEDTLQATDGRAAVACRISVDEGLGAAGLRRGDIEEILGELGELPDLWDFVLGSWEADSATSRFGPEGGQEKYVAGLKQLTSKPVVGVGRFTSPDLMVRQVRDGILDFIGAARPSIADPFLPEKIRTGALETIRECIGCNICVSGDFTMSPITQPVPVDPAADVLTPDDLMAGWRPAGSRVVVYDDDHYYLGGVLAELLQNEGFEVEIITPAPQVSAWTVNTMEVDRIQRRLLLAGVTLRTSAAVTEVGAGKVTVASTYTGQLSEAAADSVVMVTARLPEDELYLDLLARQEQGEITSVRAIGDAWAPGTIAAAVWSGRRYAEEFDADRPGNDGVPFRREVTQLHADPV